jgi:hypothetical protein
MGVRPRDGWKRKRNDGLERMFPYEVENDLKKNMESIV